MNAPKKFYRKLPITPARIAYLENFVKDAPYGAIVECGVYMGWSAAVLINACQGKRKVYLFDSYAGFPALSKSDVLPEYLRISEGSHPNSVAKVEIFLKNLGLKLDNVKFIKGFFEDTVPEWAEKVGPIALLHFDGDLYKGCRVVLKHLLPKVVEGGYFISHDYPRFPAVKKAVEEFIDPNDILTSFVESGVYKKAAL